MIYKSEMNKGLEERLIDWPASYYKEEDAYTRKDMLELAEEKGIEDEHLALRKELWKERYEERRTESFPIDKFVRGIVVGKTIINSTSNFLGFGTRRNQKLLKDVMKDLMIDQYKECDETKKQLICEEWKQLSGLYFKLCVEDKNFSTGILSMFKLSDEELLGKVADEVVVFCYQVPLMMNVESEFEKLTQIFTESYQGTFRNGEKILQPKIEKMKKSL